ncbi:hypothetical protein [Saccharothrix deserti]|uniref:hypothetical protein n=1 Tax=Saccharothrix deserti TaxID=2593674 RepID=UPI00131E7FAF|nr:hypothetical protein [Saccharothrix deserti]
MKTDVGVRVLTSAQIDAGCSIEHEVTGEEAFFSFADGAVSLSFTDKEAFRKFMGEAVKALSTLGITDHDATADAGRRGGGVGNS